MCLMCLAIHAAFLNDTFDAVKMDAKALTPKAPAQHKTAEALAGAKQKQQAHVTQEQATWLRSRTAPHRFIWRLPGREHPTRLRSKQLGDPEASNLPESQNRASSNYQSHVSQLTGGCVSLASMPAGGACGQLSNTSLGVCSISASLAICARQQYLDASTAWCSGVQPFASHSALA